MFKLPSSSALFAGLKRAGKMAAALTVAGLVTQIKPFCALLPAQAQDVLNTIGFPCAGLLGAALLGLEKMLSWKE